MIAGVALISAAGVAVFGHKTSDLVASVAAVLPGAHADDNAPIVSGKLIETAADGNGNIALNTTDIIANANTERLSQNVTGATGANSLTDLVIEAN